MKPLRTYAANRKSRVNSSSGIFQKNNGIKKAKRKNPKENSLKISKILENLSKSGNSSSKQHERIYSTNHSSSLSVGWLETTFDRIRKNKITPTKTKVGWSETPFDQIHKNKFSPTKEIKHYNLRSGSSSSEKSTSLSFLKNQSEKHMKNSNSKIKHETDDSSGFRDRLYDDIGSYQLIIEPESERKTESFNLTLSNTNKKSHSKLQTDTFSDNIDLVEGIGFPKFHSTLILPKHKAFTASTPLKKNYKVPNKNTSLVASHCDQESNSIIDTKLDTISLIQIKETSDKFSEQSIINISLRKSQEDNEELNKKNVQTDLENSISLQVESKSQDENQTENEDLHQTAMEDETKLNKSCRVVLEKLSELCPNELEESQILSDQDNANETKLNKPCHVVIEKCNNLKSFTNHESDNENDKENFNETKLNKNCQVVVENNLCDSPDLFPNESELSDTSQSSDSVSSNRQTEDQVICDKIKIDFPCNPELYENSILNKSIESDLSTDNDLASSAYSDTKTEEIDKSISKTNSVPNGCFVTTRNRTKCAKRLSLTDDTCALDSEKNDSNSVIDEKLSSDENSSCNESNVVEISSTIEETEDELDIITSPINFNFKLQPGKKWRRSLTYLQKASINQSPQRKGRGWRPSFTATLNENSACLRALSLENRKKKLSFSEIGVQTSEEEVALSKVSKNKNSYLEKDLETYTILDESTIFSNSKGYVSNVDRNSIEGLDENFQNLSISLNGQKIVANANYSSRCTERGSEFHHDVRVLHQPYSAARSAVLQRCHQTEPVDFQEYYPDSTLKKCHKIGEGVYGEVYLLKNAAGGMTVLKIIPIEGEQQVNDENQKKFDEIISEIVIAQELSKLRTNTNNRTSCFAEVQAVRCVQGRYPPRLIELWDLYDEDKGSENDHPSMFTDDQLYIVFELSHAGKDLEAFEFVNAEDAFSIFKQTSHALAVAEAELQFEHRDLHWGNLLISHTEEKKIDFIINGCPRSVTSRGFKVTIIDYTLSRVTYNNVCIYNNLALDPDLFNSHGDYQFEIYKLMQQQTKNEWERFEPYTNVLWLHYIILKMLNGVSYRRTNSVKHGRCIKIMEDLSETLLQYRSSDDFVKLYFKRRI